MTGSTKHSEAPLSGMAAIKIKLTPTNVSELVEQSVPHMLESCEAIITLEYCPFPGMANACQFRIQKTGVHIYNIMVRGSSQQFIHRFININKNSYHTKS